MPETALIGSTDLTRKAGITYSRLEILARRGLIRPEWACGGPGYQRRWSPEAVPVARLAGRLAGAGLSLRAAEKVIRSGEFRCEIAPGIWIEVRDA